MLQLMTAESTRAQSAHVFVSSSLLLVRYPITIRKLHANSAQKSPIFPVYAPLLLCPYSAKNYACIMWTALISSMYKFCLQLSVAYR